VLPLSSPPGAKFVAQNPDSVKIRSKCTEMRENCPRIHPIDEFQGHVQTTGEGGFTRECSCPIIALRASCHLSLVPVFTLLMQRTFAAATYLHPPGCLRPVQHRGPVKGDLV
jgi:hypothetical protein